MTTLPFPRPATFDAPPVLRQFIAVPAHDTVIGSTLEELDLLKQFYAGAYNEDYDLKRHLERETPRHQARVSAFELAATPLTVQTLVEFLEDTAYHGGESHRTRAEREGLKSQWHAPVGEKKRSEYFAIDPTTPDASWLLHPVSCLDWAEALHVCHWMSAKAGLIDPHRPGERLEDMQALFAAAPRPEESRPDGTPPPSAPHRAWPGYRLPTSAEWEAASRFAPGHTPPVNPSPWWWGDNLHDGDGRCNAADYTSKRRFRGWVTCPWEGTHIYTAPVATRPATPAGFFDMAGNIWEWCLDTFHPGFYADGPKADPLCLWSLPGLPPAEAPRIARGGGWHNLPANIRQASRRVHEPDRIRCNLGLRPARTLP